MLVQRRLRWRRQFLELGHFCTGGIDCDSPIGKAQQPRRQSGSISLASGTSGQLRALAAYSDSSTQDVTSAAVWSSADPTLATVNNLGAVSALKVGTVNVTASFGGQSAGSAVTINSATLLKLSISSAGPRIASGTAQQLTVTGTFSDGSTQNLTSSVSYSSSNPAMASVSAGGSVLGLTPGTVTVQAALLGVTSDQTLTVTSAVLTSTSISPASLSLARGTGAQLRLLGDFSDGSTQDLTSSAVWASNNSLAATVSNLGLVSAVQVGTANVTASFNNLQASASISVTPAVLVNVTINPASAVISQGNTIQLQFLSGFSDGSTQDMTNVVNWMSSNTSLATVDAQGLVTATSAGANIGPLNITVAFGSFSAAAAVNVTYFSSPAQQLAGCITNLQSISIALEMYSTDNAGHYPHNIALLTPSYLTPFPVCPAAGFDTYSQTYEWGLSPDAYTFYRSGLHHAAADYPANYPQYSSYEGVLRAPGVPLPPMTPAQQLTTCQANLKNIATGCELYSTDNQGAYPLNVAQLVPNYLRAIPMCPSAAADTYSQSYQSSLNPSAYSFFCSGLNHAAVGLPANFPQYNSNVGVITHP